ncbi:MAG: hypothetical protein LQ346_004365 [Caloplaca aetnensis]|nr:MAG: hypothetical protein LQ346_004365 [Caloplaca aetnensis]
MRAREQPIRRLSASGEPALFRSAAQRGQQQPPFADGSPFGDAGQRSLFGIPSPVTRPAASQFGAMDMDTGSPGYGHTIASVLDYGQANRAFQESQIFTSPPNSSNPFSPERQRKTLRFADDDDGANEATVTPTMTLFEQMHHVFALHALLQGHGTGLQNPIPHKLKMQPPRQRTLILGHKAGLYLSDYRYECFCAVAKALALHEQQTFGYVMERGGPAKEAGGFAVEIEGDRRRKGGNAFMFSQSTFKENYHQHILPVLQRNELDKPRVRVRAQTDVPRADRKVVEEVPHTCGFVCGCDDSRELELVALDVGYLRVFAEWHRWREETKLLSNSRVFEATLFDLLFPEEAFIEGYYMLELPGGESYRLRRGTEPLLSEEIQRAFTDLTTRERQEGVVPMQVKLWPVKGPLVDRGQASPARKSPALVRPGGAIIIHRPARHTHFTYDPPHTMERFFAMARSELYPNTKGQLRLRLSPSRAFQEEGKLLAPIVESESGYTTVDSTGGTLEDWWKAEILDKWLTPEEDVWAVKIFDSILVKDGTDLTKKPQKWDLSALQDTDPETETETETGDDNGDAPENWNIPPESLSTGLAEIAHRLLNIDPRASSEGILLHVLHRHPPAANGKKEWLRWTADHSFTHFLTQVLYKIDGGTIAIYPGDHEETTDSMRALVASTARGLREAVDYEEAAELGHVQVPSYLSDEERRRPPPAKKANQEASSPDKKKRGGGGNKKKGADEPPPPTRDSTITISTDSSSSAAWDPAQVRALEGEELEEALRKQRNNPFAKPRSPTRVRDVDVTVGPRPRRDPPPSRPLLLPPPVRETDNTVEMGLLRQRLHRAENEVLEREHRCRVCGVVFTQQTEEVVRKVFRAACVDCLIRMFWVF